MKPLDTLRTKMAILEMIQAHEGFDAEVIKGAKRELGAALARALAADTALKDLQTYYDAKAKRFGAHEFVTGDFAARKRNGATEGAFVMAVGHPDLEILNLAGERETLSKFECAAPNGKALGELLHALRRLVGE